MPTNTTNPKPTGFMRPLALEMDILCRSRNLRGISALKEDRDGNGPILGRKHYLAATRLRPTQARGWMTTRSLYPPTPSFLSRVGRRFGLDSAAVFALAAKYARECSEFSIRRAREIAEERKGKAAAHPAGKRPASRRRARSDEIHRQAFIKATSYVIRATSLRCLEPKDMGKLIDDLWLHSITRKTSSIDIIMADGSTNPEVAFIGRLAKLEDENLFRELPSPGHVKSASTGQPIVDTNGSAASRLSELELLGQDLAAGFTKFVENIEFLRASISATAQLQDIRERPAWPP